MTTFAVLLRGINLGSHNRVAMADLRALFAALGYRDARTLLQSGNVVITADIALDDLSRELELEIAAGLGIRTQVVVRTREQLAAAVARDPLGEIADQPKLYQVSFLSSEPDPHAVRQIAAVDVAPERFVHVGREIYAWHPNGIQRSPLAKLLSERNLGVAVTARNWITTTKLLEMATEHERAYRGGA